MAGMMRKLKPSASHNRIVVAGVARKGAGKKDVLKDVLAMGVALVVVAGNRAAALAAGALMLHVLILAAPMRRAMRASSERGLIRCARMAQDKRVQDKMGQGRNTPEAMLRAMAHRARTAAATRLPVMLIHAGMVQRRAQASHVVMHAVPTSVWHGLIAPRASAAQRGNS